MAAAAAATTKAKSRSAREKNDRQLKKQQQEEDKAHKHQQEVGGSGNSGDAKSSAPGSRLAKRRNAIVTQEGGQNWARSGQRRNAIVASMGEVLMPSSPTSVHQMAEMEFKQSDAYDHAAPDMTINSRARAAASSAVVENARPTGSKQQHEEQKTRLTQRRNAFVSELARDGDGQLGSLETEALATKVDPAQRRGVGKRRGAIVLAIDSTSSAGPGPGGRGGVGSGAVLLSEGLEFISNKQNVEGVDQLLGESAGAVVESTESRFHFLERLHAKHITKQTQHKLGAGSAAGASIEFGTVVQHAMATVAPDERRRAKLVRMMRQRKRMAGRS